jgi:uncharacterized protein Yka (UPF0111/DUF47 family)
MSIRLGESVEALSALEFAAGQSGISATTLELALQRMTRRVSEAAQGTGEAKKALEELNISAVKLNKIPLSKQLLVVAEAFKKVESDADRVRLAMRLFDTEGVKLVQLMKDGASGIEALTDKAADLGAVVTDESVTALAKMNDELSTFTTRIRAGATLLGGFVAAKFNKLKEFVDDLAEAVLVTAANITGPNFEKPYDLLTDKAEKAADGVKKITENTKKLVEETQKLPDSSRFAIEPSEELKSFENFLVKRAEIQSRSSSFKPNIVEKQELPQKSFKVLEKQIKLTEIATQSLAGTFENAFDTLITGAKDARQAILSLVRSFSGQFLSALTRPISENLAKFVVGSFNPVASANGNAFSGGKLMKFANGGTVNGPQLSLIGEAGPEAVLPLERDITGKLGVKSSGGGMIINQFITTNDASSFRKSKDQIMNEMKEALAVG